VAMGFSIIDVIRGASMQARHTVMALRLGDRFQALRAISLETSHLASEGGPERKRETALVRAGMEIAARIDSDVSGNAGSAASATRAAPIESGAFRGRRLASRGRGR
jgi:hypothetical protein